MILKISSSLFIFFLKWHMKKSVNIKLFCGTVGMTVINIFLLIAFITGHEFGPSVL